MLSVKFQYMTLFMLITFSILNATFAENATETSDQKMQVKLYYEALCPDSIRFVRYQLYSAMITKKLLRYTDLKFIPYGKVTKWIDPETNKESLVCQHGRRECEKNAQQACIVEHNTQFEQMQMIDCLLGGFSMSQCSENLDIDVTAALECRRTRTIADILKIYGDETDVIDIWFVPSIGIDGAFERNIQNRIRNQFLSVFCSKYRQKFNTTLPNCT